MDVMHVLLEGICPNTLGLFLYEKCCVDKIFTLTWLNCEIEHFKYSFAEKGHKPDPIQKKHIVSDSRIVKQKAIVMLTLMNTLPLILFKVQTLHDDIHYKHLITLVKITQLIFSPYCDMDTVGELKMLIENFGNNWLSLYPNVKPKPKLHFLTHFPELICKFGMLRGLTCLRFEAKHGFFKDR